MKELDSPFTIWEVEKQKRVNPEYIGIGRNARCPCGSGKKYKHCCMGIENKKNDHFVFHVPRNNGNTVKDTFVCLEMGAWGR